MFGQDDSVQSAILPIDSKASHISYLTNFLQGGFSALDKLDKLDEVLLRSCSCDDREDRSEGAGKKSISSQLPGLGPEKAAVLLATSCAETSLLSAVYWVVCAHRLLGEPLPAELRPRCLELVWACYNRESGGFSPHPRQEPHLLATLSAIQLFLLLDRGDLLRQCTNEHATDSLASDVCRYVLSLQLGGGTWRGRQSEASEGDSRFVYAGLCTLALLQASSEVRIVGAVASLEDVTQWLIGCQNLDGGFGCRPDGDCESHAGHAFCCLGGLALVGGLRSLKTLSYKRLVRWLCDRQCAEGGLNGRPGKAPDACYTWWTLASAELLLSSTARTTIDAMTLQDLFQLQSLQEFVFRCSADSGGIAAHPGDDPDPFHTLFGLAGLSLLSWSDGTQTIPWLGRISPVVALPIALVPSSIHLAATECQTCVHL